MEMPTNKTVERLERDLGRAQDNIKARQLLKDMVTKVGISDVLEMLAAVQVEIDLEDPDR